ncbi:MAG TPA: hypothetical protein VFO83_06635 [Aggregicoccus sp.]|nr:hypothetical protein [Aggregicoccus sp.]
MTGALALLLASALAQPAVPLPEQGALHWRAALEVAGGAQPSAPAGPAEGGFVSLLPVLALERGDTLGLELGAPLRFRLPGGEGAGLRREDWDERSDLGQLLRELRLGAPDAALSLRAGPLQLATLGHGHLVSRYANTLAADYHPAGAGAVAHLGALRLEVLASDVLALRLFAAELRVDLGRTLSASAAAWDRAHASLSLARDVGRAGGSSGGVSAGQLDLDAALYRGRGLQLWAVAGAGARLDSAGGAGALVGLALDAQPRAFSVGGRLELRRQAGGFRQGLFDGDYELSRFSDGGLAEPSLAGQRLPAGYSGYAELSLALGEERPDAGRLLLSLGAEYFAFGRADTDLALSVQLPGGRALATLRALGTGLGEHPRVAVQAELRWRLRPALYALATAGSVHTPRPDGRLQQGLLATLGLGMDLAR